MVIMEDCMTKVEAGFYDIAAISSKEYYTYTQSVNVGLYCMTFGVKSKISKMVHAPTSPQRDVARRGQIKN